MVDNNINNNKSKPEQQNISPPLILDFTSSNPLEEDLSYLNLITEKQYNFIKQFQRAFNKQKEQPSIMLYEPRITTRSSKLKNNANRAYSPIENIADDCRDYYNYIFQYGEKNIKVIESYFCNNLTLKKLKERYTERTTKKEIIQKIKKSKNKITPRIKIKEIERIIEHFDEITLYRDLEALMGVMGRIMKMMDRMGEKDMGEEERIVKMLKNIVMKKGACRVSENLGIDIKTLKKILDGYDRYSYYLHKKIKKYIHETR